MKLYFSYVYEFNKFDVHSSAKEAKETAGRCLAPGSFWGEIKEATVAYEQSPDEANDDIIAAFGPDLIESVTSYKLVDTSLIENVKDLKLEEDNEERCE